MIRGLLLACLLVGVAAASQPPVDPAWGHYATLVGRSARPASGHADAMRWYWAEPGKTLVQEYLEPATGEVTHRETISLGAAPGTLVMQGSAWGKKTWDATVRADGSVLFVGRGLMKQPHVAEVAADGTWGRRLVKLQGDEVLPFGAPQPFRLEPRQDAVSVPTMVSTADPAWGPYADLAGRATSPSATGSALHWYWQVPGQVLVQEYRKPDGKLVRRDLITLGEAPGTLVLESQGGWLRKEKLVGTLQADGQVHFRSETGFKQYLAGEVEGAWELREVQVRDGRVQPIDQVSRYALEAKVPAITTTVEESPVLGNAAPAVLPDAALEMENLAPIVAASAPAATSPPPSVTAIDTPLANPAAWGPMHLLANRSVTYTDGVSSHYRVSPDGMAIYAVKVFPSGETFPLLIFRLAGNGVVIRRAFSPPGSNREYFYRGEAIDHQTMRWSRVGSSPDYFSDWTFRDTGAGEPGTGMYTITPYEMDPSMRPATIFFGPSEIKAPEALADAISKLRAQDVGVVARAHARWQEYLAENSGVTTTNGWASALYAGLSAGHEVAQVQEAQSRQRLDATLANINAQIAAQQAPPQPSANTSVAAVAVPDAGNASPAQVSAPPAVSAYQPLEGPGTGSWAGTGQGAAALGAANTTTAGASTRNDAATCLSTPVVSAHRCTSLSGFKAAVSNTCTLPLDVRVCFMTDRGWDCQTNYGLKPQASWEPGLCHASTGEVFHAARYSDEDHIRLESP